MTRDRFSFEGLKAIEQRLVRLADEIAYLVIQDRTDPRKDETLGRFDFTAACALPYLEGGPEPDDADDDTAFDGWEDDEPEESPAGEPTQEQIARAACRWIRDIAARCTVGESYVRFRVKVWGPKGYRMVDSGQFVCRNHDVDLDLPGDDGSPALAMPEPDFDKAALRGAAKGLQALGDLYTQWGQIVLGSIGQLQGINNQTTTRLHRQLAESRDQVDQLVASILEYRFQEATALESRRADERENDGRTALARDAIHQVGEAARALLTANGLSPEMAEVVGSLSQSPTLLDTLRDPSVRELMKNPANLEQLALMLRAAAQQAQAAPPPANPTAR